MASKNIPLIYSIGFHADRLVPGNYTTESKNHVLSPFPYEDKYLLTKQLLVQQQLLKQSTAQIMRIQTTTL